MNITISDIQLLCFAAFGIVAIRYYLLAKGILYLVESIDEKTAKYLTDTRLPIPTSIWWMNPWRFTRFLWVSDGMGDEELKTKIKKCRNTCWMGLFLLVALMIMDALRWGWF